jgi:hypothetical protein
VSEGGRERERERERERLPRLVMLLELVWILYGFFVHGFCMDFVVWMYGFCQCSDVKEMAISRGKKKSNKRYTSIGRMAETTPLHRTRGHTHTQPHSHINTRKHTHTHTCIYVYIHVTS